MYVVRRGPGQSVLITHQASGESFRIIVRPSKSGQSVDLVCDDDERLFLIEREARQQPETGERR